MHSLRPCITVPMAVIGNGLGILGWANNGGRGWTSTGVMWETCMRSLSCFANLWLFCHDDQIPAWEEKVSYRHCCWETGVHAWKLSQSRHMNFSFLRSSWRLLQFHQPWNSPIHARLSPPSLQALPNAATLQCICLYVQTRGIENKCSLCPVPTSMHDSLKTSEPCSRCQWEHQKKPACDWKCDPSYQPHFPKEGNQCHNHGPISWSINTQWREIKDSS